jgi:hypothetical protein
MKLALSMCVGLLLLLPSTSGATNDPPDIGYGNGLFSELSSCRAYGKEHPRSMRSQFTDPMVLRTDGSEIVYLYLKNHVNQRQRTSVSLIVGALAEAFPPPKAK